MKVCITGFKRQRHSKLSNVYVLHFLSKTTGDLWDNKGRGFWVCVACTVGFRVCCSGNKILSIGSVKNTCVENAIRSWDLQQQQ